MLEEGACLMPNPSNSDLVGEAKRLSEAATPGPWDWGVSAERPELDFGVVLHTPADGDEPRPIPSTKVNAEFIARARTLLPELAQQLEQAREENTRLWNELEKNGVMFRDETALFKHLDALTPDEGADPPVEEEA